MQLSLQMKGLNKWARRLDDTARRQLPFATSLAINMTTTQMKTDLEAKMRSVFDRPAPWTMNSLRIVKSTKKKLSGAVAVKDKVNKGTPAAAYLRKQIKGTRRPQKSFEGWLRHKGLIRPDQYALPAKGQRLNQYGNITAGMHRKIMTGLATKGTSKFFVPRPGGALTPGIYQRMARRKVKAKFIFTNQQPKYRARFPFAATAAKSFRKNFSRNFDKAFAQAMRTAR